MVYINECIDVNTALKNPSNLWVVWWVVHVGSDSFQGISYSIKPQVVSSYSFKSMVTTHNVNKNLQDVTCGQWWEKQENMLDFIILILCLFMT